MRSWPEPFWMEKHQYDEAERLYYEAAAALESVPALSIGSATKGEAGAEEKRRPTSWLLAGLRAESIWFRKHLFEEAERAYQTRMADRAWGSLAVTTAANKGVPEPSGARKVAACGPAPHRPGSACHHLICGIWLNRSEFEEAERLFVIHWQAAPAAPSLTDSPPTAPLAASPLTSISTTAPLTALPITSSSPIAPLTASSLTGSPSTAVPFDGSPAIALPLTGSPPLTGFPPTVLPITSSPPTDLPTVPLPTSRQSFKLGTTPDEGYGSSSTTPGTAGCLTPGPGLPAPALGESERAAPLTSWLLQCLLHRDSEPVWLNKAACDQAERRYQEAKAQSVAAGLQELTRKEPGKSTEAAALNKNMAGEGLAQEKIWFDKYKYDDAEKKFYENLNSSVCVSMCPAGAQENGASNILRDIARARENIQKSLAGSAVQGADNGELCNRVTVLEKENESLRKLVEDLRLALSKLESRLCTVEKSAAGIQAPLGRQAAPAQQPPSKEAPAEDDDDDDDIDLFGSDEDDEASRIREERIRQYSQRKSQKPTLIAKSSILLDVKPWSDETDMVKLEECVRSVQVDGLLWGCSKLLPVGYGIQKLQIQCVVEDDKVGTDLLEEEITKFDEFVQSVDVAAFNKI